MMRADPQNPPYQAVSATCNALSWVIATSFQRPGGQERVERGRCAAGVLYQDSAFLPGEPHRVRVVGAPRSADVRDDPPGRRGLKRGEEREIGRASCRERV